MAQFKQPTKAIVPTPATLTEEIFNNTVALVQSHFEPIITPELMIAHRKGVYALVINSTVDGASLEATLGTANAKACTEMVLNALSAHISTITTK